MNEGNGNRHSPALGGIVSCNLFREQFGKVYQNYTHYSAHAIGILLLCVKLYLK